MRAHPWIVASPLFTSLLLIFVSGRRMLWFLAFMGPRSFFTCDAANGVILTSAIRLVAGIPILEESHEKRYGKDPAYKTYKAQTSLLIPWPKAKSSA